MKLLLKEMLAKRRVTQSQLARGIGVTPYTVNTWLRESGSRFPEPYMLEDICLFLECTLADLILLDKKETASGTTYSTAPFGVTQRDR